MWLRGGLQVQAAATQGRLQAAHARRRCAPFLGGGGSGVALGRVPAAASLQGRCLTVRVDAAKKKGGGGAAGGKPASGVKPSGALRGTTALQARGS